ncbi:sigma-54-dependent transcriptional regulator [Thalassoroseus pseudoceratinae]|uniref:sigma-54-dependent transcriptional regulator n=1 Tax=Thalassoroseus pseudoceratinae TaxID=2713176 RepID=UPI001422BA74|nr:sigma-54 dependent transcriptional regulator [Thalassoroseus pseudoceratinae]
MVMILVIDDETRHCDTLKEFLANAGHEVNVAGSAERGMELAAETTPDIVFLDIRLPRMDGLTAITELRKLSPDAPVIMMTAYGTLDTAAAAVQAGVFDYLVKPFSLEELKGVLHRATNALQANMKPTQASADQSASDVVIGQSPPMQRIFNRVALVAASDVPVLLTGESGTGKEVFARAIHRYSSRRDQPFVPVFLAALSPTLIESELFGHARGAYTGADVERPGLLEQAGEGTVLLDELGDVPLPLQVKLLRAIEEKEVTRVGENHPRPMRARFLAATNKHLPNLIAAGLFREDLYYRLSVYHIELPPLRERTEDIPVLADHFLQQSANGSRNSGFLKSTIEEMVSRRWYGNIRELRNAVEHAAIASRGAAIAVEHLPQPASPTNSDDVEASWSKSVHGWLDQQIASIDPLVDRDRLHEKLLGEIEPILFRRTLKHCRNNYSAAARVLGIDPKTLRTRLSPKPK